MIGNTIADKITKASNTANKNEAENIELNKKIPKTVYIYIYIYITRKKTTNYWWAEINVIYK